MNKNSGETVSLFDRISRNKHVEYIDEGDVSEWSLNGQVKTVLHSQRIAKPVACSLFKSSSVAFCCAILA